MNPQSLSPPPALLQKDGENHYDIKCREGGRLVFPADRLPALPLRLPIVVSASIALEGQPVRCSGLLPGVSVRMQFAQRLVPEQMNSQLFILGAWCHSKALLDNWLATRGRAPSMTVESAGMKVQFAHDALRQLRPGVMQIDMLHGIGATA
jgi:hypothetical protein